LARFRLRGGFVESRSSSSPIDQILHHESCIQGSNVCLSSAGSSRSFSR
jgi:hypothetical protein